MDESRKKAEYIKAVVANYFLKKRHFPMVAIEAKAKLKPRGRGDRADLLAVTRGNILIEVEVKTNVGDLKGDMRKEIHSDLLKSENKYPVHYFCFAVLDEFENAAKPIIRELYPYAGLIVVKDHPRFHYPDADIVISPKKFKKPPLNEVQLREMYKSMSANICRMSYRLIGVV